MAESDIQARPAANDRAGWRAYWDAQGQPWRTEPEARPERQSILRERMAQATGEIPAPFRDMKMDRTDVEWLIGMQASQGMRAVATDEPPYIRQDGVNLQGADLRQARLGGLPLARANFNAAKLDKANLNRAHLERASFANSQCVGTIFTQARLEDASFRQANVQEAVFTEAHMESANLYQAQCQNASLYNAHLEGAYLGHAEFGGATLRRAFFDAATSWNDAVLWDAQHVTCSLADAHWTNTNLATLDWAQVRMIGDEREARSATDRDGKPKPRQKWQDNLRRAVRANRQLAVALRGQGMNEEADRFAYRAQLCQRSLLLHQARLGPYVGSGLLDLLAGYGFKPVRTLLVYLVMILGYASVYFALHQGSISSPVAALIFSITSFHGRGFFPGGLALDAPTTIAAASEAIIGLIIEVSFIATFTQRFFAR